MVSKHFISTGTMLDRLVAPYPNQVSMELHEGQVAKVIDLSTEENHLFTDRML